MLVELRIRDYAVVEDLTLELGAGLNYYFAQHPFKLQTDAFQLWDEEFSSGTTEVRVQLQMAF